MPEDAAIRRTQLKRTQQQALAALTADGTNELSRSEYEELTGVSRSQAAYDLAELVEAGLLRRVGAGRATRYRLAREGGNQRHWTNERIRSELEAFCGGRAAWPTAGEFKAAGRGDLYVAASRYGGIRHWADALGFPPAGKAVPAEPEPRQASLLGRVAWAGAGAMAAAVGAVAAIGLVVAGVALLVSLTRSGPSSTLSSGPIGKAPAHRATKTFTPPKFKATRAQQARAAVRRTRAQVATSRPAAPRTTTPSATSLATYAAKHTTSPPARTVSSHVEHTAAPPSSVPTGSVPTGPSPLAAPPSATSPPQPLAAPRK